MSVLLFNLLLYLVPCISLLLIDKGLTLRTILLLFISFNALCSIYTWNNGIYLEFSSGLYYNEISVLPALLIWIGLMIVFLPILQFREKSIEIIQLPPPGKIKYFSIFGTVLGLLLIAMMIIPVLKGLMSGFGELYVGSKTGEALFSGIVYKLYHLYSSIQIPLMLYWGYYISFIKKSKLNSLLLFIAAFIPSIIYGIGGASRGMLFFRFIDAFIILLIFRKFIDRRMLQRAGAVLILFVAFLLFVSILITKGRFGEGNIIFKIIAQYFGESFINANIHFFENVKSPLFGERMFPDLYTWFSGNSIENFSSKFEAWSYYTNKVEVYIHYFKTLPIDFYIEFGVIGAGIIILFLSIVGKRYIKESAEMPFYRLFWVVYFYQICMGSIFGFTKAGHDNMLRFLGLVILYLFFRINFSKITLQRI
ncbi:hypothetical protein DMA11_17585 [Marinilabiliaceae bacterium JC017]|nr:hypothetical protein DMA11_17585 [Marinilabiliaceae bacterium JC017]